MTFHHTDHPIFDASTFEKLVKSQFLTTRLVISLKKKLTQTEFQKFN